jgi:hypothetical protein
MRAALYKSTRRAHTSATTAATNTSALRKNPTTWMIKPSNTQAATSRIRPATAVRPKDLEDLGGELFIPISLPVGAAEQEE